MLTLQDTRTGPARSPDTTHTSAPCCGADSTCTTGGEGEGPAHPTEKVSPNIPSQYFQYTVYTVYKYTFTVYSVYKVYIRHHFGTADLGQVHRFEQQLPCENRGHNVLVLRKLCFPHLHVNTEYRVSEYLHPGRSFPKS